MPAGLLFESSNGASRFWVMDGCEVIVGRRPPWNWPNVRVSSQLVSREHARITARTGSFMVEDAGSCGGLYLDDVLVRGRMPIGPGMRLKLCSEVAYTLRTLTAEPLWDRLNGKPLPTAIALCMAEQILRALLLLHESGRCHGDLSPHEILCVEDGSFVLLVQGWAETGKDAIRGNPTYAAPETITEDRIEAATDIYVLGLILFEALSGSRPFPFENPMSHIASKLAGVPSSLLDAMSPALRAWLERAMQVDPRQRPSSREAIDLLPGRSSCVG